MASHGLLPAHNLPTHGKTSIGHIILKTKWNATTLVIESTVTVYSAVMLALSNIRTSTVITTRSNIDFIELDKHIKNLHCSKIYKCSNSNVAFEYFVNYLSRAIRMSSKT